MRIAFGLQAGLFRVLDFGPAGLDPSVRERGARWVFLMWFSTSHLCDCTKEMKNTWPLSVHVFVSH